MAVMCPEIPKEFDPYSFEDIMFKALEQLPDDFYVFHSFSVVRVQEGSIDESETDFVIFNPKLGIMAIEAKAGRPEYRGGAWYYGSGIKMAHDGPFRQASRNKHNLLNIITSQGYAEIARHCKFVHAVWFISVGNDYFIGKSLPQEAPIELILTKDSIDQLEDALVQIFELETRFTTDLDNRSTNVILNSILAPQFGTISIAEYRRGHEKMVFKSLLKEQIALLDYLEEQPDAIINGLAGTGKTVMAIEKARRHANRGEKVLFLCYNAKLKDYLRTTHSHENIDFYTIDGYACEKCNTPVADYRALRDVLETYYLEGTFPYQHIVIDEGQDFGRNEITGRENQAEIDILDLLKHIILDPDSGNRTFYMFYDKNQLVQAAKVPDYIREADCKLTLYRNCRNTMNIAETSVRLLGNGIKSRIRDGAAAGSTPLMYISPEKQNLISKLNVIIEKYWKIGISDIQILTCKTTDTSILSSEYTGEVYYYKGVQIPFTTCRKFKGLEADAVILVDMDFDFFKKDENKIYYIGSSRARHELALLVSMNDEECRFILDHRGKKVGRNPMKAFASMYNAKIIKNETN